MPDSRSLFDTGDTSVSLAVRVSPDAGKQELAAEVGHLFHTEWRVDPLFEDDPTHPTLSRWFLVREPAAVTGESVVQATWEAAHRLQATGPYEIEPQVPKSTYQRTEYREWDSFCDSGDDLPGSASVDWALKKIRAPEAWDLEPAHPEGARRGEGVVIGHPDTGYTEHTELYPGSLDLEGDWDVLDGDDDAHDPLLRGNPGHGTSTGVVIASREDGKLSGAAPLATLRPIRSITSVIVLRGAPIAVALNHARRSGCRVVSMSLGGLFLESIRDTLDAAVADGLIVLAAAGNCWRTVADPAHFRNCIAVAATNAEDKPWKFSARGDRVAVSAPGESVHTAHVPGGRDAVRQSSGTSFAVAHVAGVAALWLAHHGPDRIQQRYGGGTSAAFREVIRSTAWAPDDWDSRRMGSGIVNAEAALSAELPPVVASGPEGDRPEPYPRSGREVLEEISASHPSAPLAQLPAVIEAFEAEGTREQKELLYREYVYHLTETPGVGAAMSEEAGPEALDGAIREVASPTLVSRLTLGSLR